MIPRAGVRQMKTKTRNNAHKQDTTKRYSATKKGMFWFNTTKNQWVPLSNFTAKIRADIIRDDGTGDERLYELEVTVGKEKKRFLVEAIKFPNMQWVAEHVGAAGNISAGPAIKDNLRAAIQSVSYPIPTQTVFSHVDGESAAISGCTFIRAVRFLTLLSPGWVSRLV